YAFRLRRPRDADRLVDAGERIGGDHVSAASGEGRDLRAVIVFGLRSVHVAGLVAVAARPDSAADHAGRGWPFPIRAQLLQKRDRSDIDRVKRGGIVAELDAPVRIRTPRRT